MLRVRGGEVLAGWRAGPRPAGRSAPSSGAACPARRRASRCTDRRQARARRRGRGRPCRARRTPRATRSRSTGAAVARRSRPSRIARASFRCMWLIREPQSLQRLPRDRRRRQEVAGVEAEPDARSARAPLDLPRRLDEGSGLVVEGRLVAAVAAARENLPEPGSEPAPALRVEPDARIVGPPGPVAPGGPRCRCPPAWAAARPDAVRRAASNVSSIASSPGIARRSASWSAYGSSRYAPARPSRRAASRSPSSGPLPR